MRDLILLMRKNLKEDSRRVKGLICEMLFPVLVFLLFAFLRTLIDKEEVAINYADGFGEKIFVEYDYKSINDTQAYQDIARLICNKQPTARSRQSGNYAASYLAIIPSPESNEKIRYIMDKMQNYWKISKTQWDEDLCEVDEFKHITSMAYYSCRSECEYDELEFTEGKNGSILKYFNSETELSQYLNNDKYGSKPWDPKNINDDGIRPIGFAVIFDEYDDWNSITYTLRGNASYVPTTQGSAVNIFEKDFTVLFNSGYGKYYQHGLVQIQNRINQIITEKIAILNNIDKKAYQFQYGIYAMPTGAYLTDNFYTILAGMLPFMMILAFIYPYFVISGYVVEEKSCKIKEGLRMMGASTTSYWLSIYCYFGLKFIIISFLCTSIAWLTNVFQFSEFFIIFIWFTLFLFTLLTSAIMFSTFFDNKKTASMVSSIFLLTLYFMSAAAPSMDNESLKAWLCLSGPACFAMSTNNFGKYEEGLIGLQWNNINDEYDYLKFSTALIMMVIDCIIYIILAMYLDQVIPSKYGQRLPPYFIFQQSFWCPKTGKNERNCENAPILKSKKYEKIDKQGIPSIQIRNLKKVFSTGFNSEPLVAVNDISFDIYENEIFCLLGHNGAGKTTTISMLTGMLNISSGSATINGKDVATEMSQIRQSLGVCVQHDVLWSTLTVEEHLTLFANLKGVEKNKVQQEVDAMIDAGKMQDKRDKYPTQLSGGQKRKLSLSIALIGGSKIIFLDEPTSGMDPHSRRDAWELIKKSSKGRTIVLTTHYMDEADILSDRIAIMAKGRIECCGSSLFLKRLYGVGYSFTISVNTDIAITDVSEDINDLIQNQINTAQLLSNCGSELIYRLPFDASSYFPSLFRLIDTKKDNLHIDSYGISVTTLEEVFIKVGHGSQRTLQEASLAEERDFENVLKKRRRSSVIAAITTEMKLDNAKEIYNAEEIEMASLYQKETRRRLSSIMGEIRIRSLKNLFFVHVWAMLYKKWNYSKRDKRAMLCQMVLPVLFMVFGFALVNLEPPLNYPRLKLDMTQFEDLDKTNKIPYNLQSISSINPFPAIWEENINDNSTTLLPLNGGDNGKAYEYNTTTQQSMHTYFDSMLAISDVKPFKYISYYFPIYERNITTLYGQNKTLYGQNKIDPLRHIGIGANVSAYHSLPVAINIASNLALKKIKNDASINGYIQPLPTTPQQTEQSKMIESFIYSTYLSFGFAFFPVGIIYSIVYEKENLSKFQLLISGMNSIAYWLGNYIFDILTILPSCLFAIILIFSFDVSSFKHDALFPFVLIVLFYGISIVPFSYLFSWCFKSSTKAQYIALISFIFLGFGFSLTTFILDLFPSTRDPSQIIKEIVRFSPSYCAAAAMLNLATRDAPVVGLWKVGDSPFHWEITGRLITFMAFESVLYFLLTLIIEYLSNIPEVNAFFGLVTNIPKEQDKHIELDEDVVAEQNKLKEFISTDNDEFDFNECKDPIVITGLRKIYNTDSTLKKILNKCKVDSNTAVTAVKDVWFSVPCGQIFGFLGVNGAGKTTTLSMLCGKFPPSQGTAYINRIPISNQIACRRMIGYCPQFDAIFDLLTAREHLTIYGMIKGLNENDIDNQSNKLINSLSLSPYANKMAGTYSGGNKRKLSVAMAMIGTPIVFLDEPSCGMDPVSRRSMWDFISQSMNHRSVILTTHSMEECQALCHRIGIMVKGQLTCLGTSQRLKKRYGKGFQLDVNISVNKQNALTNELNLQFGQNFQIQILETHDENIKYKIYQSQSGDNKDTLPLTLADMFEKLELINEKIDIDGGYALNQTTLEQIFIQMANQYQ